MRGVVLLRAPQLRVVAAAAYCVFAHFTLLLADTLETLLFTVIMQRRDPIRYYPGVAEDAFYSYFMVAVWIPCFVTVYLVPRWV